MLGHFGVFVQHIPYCWNRCCDYGMADLPRCVFFRSNLCLYCWGLSLVTVLIGASLACLDVRMSGLRKLFKCATKKCRTQVRCKWGRGGHLPPLGLFATVSSLHTNAVYIQHHKKIETQIVWREVFGEDTPHWHRAQLPLKSAAYPFTKLYSRSTFCHLALLCGSLTPQLSQICTSHSYDIPYVATFFYTKFDYVHPHPLIFW